MSVVRKILAAVTAASLCLIAAPATAQAETSHHHRYRCTPGVRALPDLNNGISARAVAFNRRHVYVGSVTDSSYDSHASYWDEAGLHLIDLPGLRGTQAWDINERGTIIGTGVTDDLTTENLVGWVFENGKVHRLAWSGREYVAWKINNRGAIVGYGWPDNASTGDARTSRPIRWRSWRAAPEVLRGAGLGSTHGGEALGLNDRGAVVGRVVPTNATGYSTDLYPQDPVRWNGRGRVRPLPTSPSAGLVHGVAQAVNNRGQVAGGMSAAGTAAPLVAVRWSRRNVTTIGHLRSDDAAYGVGISPNGWVVGVSTHRDARQGLWGHAFFWPGHGPMLALPPLAGDWAASTSTAYDVGADGTVVGTSTSGPPGTDGFRSQATVWTCAQRQAVVPPASCCVPGVAGSAPADRRSIADTGTSTSVWTPTAPAAR